MANMFAMAMAIMIVAAASAKATDLSVPTAKQHVRHHRHFGLPHRETKKQFKKDVARDPDVGKPSEFVK